MRVTVHTSDPGLDSILAAGSGIDFLVGANVVPNNSLANPFVGIVGQVVNDKGTPNQPIKLTSIDDIYKTYGGYASWLGTNSSGNLASLVYGLSARNVVMVAVNAEGRTGAGAVVYMQFTRAASTPDPDGVLTIPAGTRFSDGSSWIVATLEDVTWGDGVSGAKNVRFRNVSGTAGDIADIDTAVSYTLPSGVTITSSTATVAATDLDDRYEEAIDHILDNVHGMRVSLLSSDRMTEDVIDALLDHAVQAYTLGFPRTCFVSPPNGTTQADATTTSGVATENATLFPSAARDHVVFIHPGFLRYFKLANTREYVPAAMFTCFYTAQFRAEENPAADRGNLFSDYGFLGIEQPSDGYPDPTSYFSYDIMQPNVAVNVETGLVAPGFENGVLLSGAQIASQRLKNYLITLTLIILQKHLKKLANARNKETMLSALNGAYSKMTTKGAPNGDARIDTYTMSLTYPAANTVRIDFEAVEFGNMNNIIFSLTVTQ